MSTDINTHQIGAVLFDLDGALVDTAPDLAAALNAVLEQHGNKPINYSSIRSIISNGASGLIVLGFGKNLSESEQAELKSALISHYQQHIAHQSTLFEGLATALLHLENLDIPWGIVTNKPEYLTLALLDKLALREKAACIVCGDQVSSPKPHPESIYLACKKLNVAPKNAIYIGDAQRDIRAGRMAGLKTIACAYGYIPADENISDWQADMIVESSQELLKFIQKIN
jgi:phosphoglycolate phosphatase